MHRTGRAVDRTEITLGLGGALTTKNGADR